MSSPGHSSSRNGAYRERYIVGEHFEVGAKIGEGSFGIIHQGLNLKNNTYVAVKLEPAATLDPQLRDEYKVYRHLAGYPGFPRVHYYATEGDVNILCLDLLGPSLEQLFEACGRRFSIKTVAMLARQMITRIKLLHEKHLIYRDIKPDNYLIGLPDTPTESTVFLIDFGLAKRYWSPQTRKHIPFSDKKHVTGTARYMSINTHMGAEQSRRDDLESLGFVFLYFLRGRLPWQGMNAKTNAQRNEMIGQKKLGTSIEELCAGQPAEFAEYLYYVRRLKFEETPDYQFLLNLFGTLLRRMGEVEDFVFDWVAGGQTNGEVAMTNREARKPVASDRAMHAGVNPGVKPPPSDLGASAKIENVKISPGGRDRRHSNQGKTTARETGPQATNILPLRRSMTTSSAAIASNTETGTTIAHARRSNPALAVRDSEYTYAPNSEEAKKIHSTTSNRSRPNAMPSIPSLVNPVSKVQGLDEDYGAIFDSEVDGAVVGHRG